MENSTKQNNLISLIVLIAYGIVGFISNFGSYENSVTQWLYISIVNVVVFGLIVFNKYQLTKVTDKLVKFFAISHLGLLAIGILSSIQSIVIDESILLISRYITFLGVIINLFVLLSDDNRKPSFEVVSKIVAAILFFEVFNVCSYFLSNYSTPRTLELIKGLPHYYGNRNILAIAIAIKLPFALYLVYKAKSFWKYFSLITVFMVIAAIFFIGARTSMLALGLLLVLFSLFHLYIERKQLKTAISNVGALVIVTVLAVLVVANVNKIYKDKWIGLEDIANLKTKKELYLSHEQRGLVQSGLTDSNGRSYFWKRAVKDASQNLALGVGIGNWSYLEKDELYREIKSDKFVFFSHVHNDFLQHFVEEGVLGLIFYTLIFVIAFLILIKKIRSVETSEKYIFAILFLALFAYTIDAFLNFPQDRAPIQVLLAFIYAFILVFSFSFKTNDKQVAKPNFNIATIVLSVLLLGTLFVNYKSYKSTVVQFKMAQDFQNKETFTQEFSMSYQELLKELPDFPSVNILGQSLDHVKALYAINSKNYDEAHKHIDASIKAIPTKYESYGLKAVLFNHEHQYDSAFVYAKALYDKMPTLKNNFNVLNTIYQKRGENDLMFHTLDKFLDKKPKLAQFWRRKSALTYQIKKDKTKALAIVDSGLFYNPESKLLKDYKAKLSGFKTIIAKPEFSEQDIDQRAELYDKGNRLFDAGKFAEAKTQFLNILLIDKTNIASKYKLGLLEVKLKNYQQAILYFNDVIATDLIKGGKPEYNRGFSYFKLQQVEKAKADFTTSYNKGFGLAKKLDKRMLNL